MNVTGKEYLARGKRGIVSTGMLDGKRIIIKELNPSADVNTIAHEAEMLQAVNAKGIGPLFIGLQNGALLREYIDGPEIMDWIPGARRGAIKSALIAVLEQCRTLDLLGINKLEMNHPHKHILMRKDIPVFIDFDRARHAQKPKNVTQVCQWLTGSQMVEILNEKDVTIPRDAMIKHAKKYKDSYSDIPYNLMVEVIRNA